jgi:hypothetical protein
MRREIRASGDPTIEEHLGLTERFLAGGPEPADDPPHTPRSVPGCTG